MTAEVLKAIAGRWVFVDEDLNGQAFDKFAVIDEAGKVTFVDDPEGDDMLLVPDGDGFSFRTSQGEVCARVQLSNSSCDLSATTGQVPVLSFTGEEDGHVEQWHKSSGDCGKPKIVRRGKTGNLSRNWTKEGQEGSPKAGQRKMAMEEYLARSADKAQAERAVEAIKQKYREVRGSTAESEELDSDQIGNMLKNARADISDAEVIQLINACGGQGGKVKFDVFVDFLFAGMLRDDAEDRFQPEQPAGVAGMA